jgi:hypothetical protein
MFERRKLRLRYPLRSVLSLGAPSTRAILNVKQRTTEVERLMLFLFSGLVKRIKVFYFIGFFKLCL